MLANKETHFEKKYNELGEKWTEFSMYEVHFTISEHLFCGTNLEYQVKI